MVSFENFVKAKPPSLSELKVTPSFCFPFKIPDELTATNKYIPYLSFKGNLEVYKKHICSNLRKSYYAGGVGNQICVSKEVAVTENNALNSEIDLTEENYAAEELKEVLSEFECPVCFEIMMPPKRIYSCSNDHYICSLCLTDTKMKACPLCREDFTVTRPCIRHTSERFLTRFLQKS